MQIELVQCTVQMNQKEHRNLSTIVKSGPDAVTVPELVLLNAQHSIDMTEAGCAIRDAVVVGKIDIGFHEEIERLASKGFPRALIERVFPLPRHMPATLNDADLPPTAFGKPLRQVEAAEVKAETPAPASAAPPAARKKALRDALTAAGITIPAGNLTEDDLRALAEENAVAVA